MKLLTFAIERSIVLTSFGVLVIVIIKVLLGRFLISKVPNLWLRTCVYAFCGAVGIMYDYSNYFADEFSKLTADLFITVFVTSFAWMYLLVAPIAYLSFKRKEKKAEQSSSN